MNEQMQCIKCNDDSLNKQSINNNLICNNIDNCSKYNDDGTCYECNNNFVSH